MIFEQFYLAGLGHGSYLLGSEATGEAVVVDPRRDPDVYFAAAQRHGLRIRYALDTHQHNDYVSGLCELPRRDDVRLLASARAQLGYPARRLEDGSTLDLGELQLRVMETPGHTPEHISIVIVDRARGEEPAILLSGGALLVGDIGRPDLLGNADETREHAQRLGQTLRDKLLGLPDHVAVYPTHLSGSLCGASIDARLSSTLGYERRTNALLACAADPEGDFAGRCMDYSRLPAVPPYWRRMRTLNQEGPPVLGLATAPALGVEAFEDQCRRGAVVLDCRAPEAFGVHIPGALNAGLRGAFATWAGTVVPPDRPVLLVVDGPQDVPEACRQLQRVGYDTPAGWLAGGMRAWRTAGRPLRRLPQWSVGDLHEAHRRVRILDVRQPGEWHAFRIPEAVWITGAELPARIEELDGQGPYAVVCGSGYRSSAAAALLLQHGKPVAANVLGGMTAWRAAGFEVEH